MTTMFDYSKAILKAIKENPNNRGKKIEHCTLRLEMPLSKSNSYQFPLLDSDQKTAALTERRLSADDQFVPFAMALKHYVRDTSVVGSEIIAQLNNFVDAQKYPTTDVAVMNPAHLEALYKAEISLTRSNEVVMPALYTDIFRQVPEQQSTAAFQNQTSENDGFVPLLEAKRIYGNGQNVIRLDCPQFDYLWQYPAAANRQVRVVLLMKGFKLS